MTNMSEMRATLVAFVQPPGVQWVNHEGSLSLNKIYMTCPRAYRFAIVKRNDAYEVLDFWEMTQSASGWLIPRPGVIYDDPDAAVVATVLINHDV